MKNKGKIFIATVMSACMISTSLTMPNAYASDNVASVVADVYQEDNTVFTTYEDEIQNFRFALREDGSLEMTAYYGDAKNISIPTEAYYEGYTKRVTAIGSNVFSRYLGLEKVEIPSTIKEIGRAAFYGCENLSEITIPTSVNTINEYAFCRCNSLLEVKLLSGVTKICYGAFAECKNLQSVSISSSVKELEEAVFYGCDNLTTITVNSTNTVFDSRDNCNAIIDKASNSLVVGCKNTTIPESVVCIADYAFYKCNGLKNINIHKNVEDVGSTAFLECYNIESIVVEAGNKRYDSRNNCNALLEENGTRLVLGCKNTTIPSSVTRINDASFTNCTQLESITIPENVTEIGVNAFVNCRNLKSVVIENEQVVPEGDMFFGCNDKPVVYMKSITGAKKFETTYGYKTRVKQSVSISKIQNMKVGETQNITVTGNKSSLKFESSDESVLKVDDSGVITAVDAGEATVTVSALEENYYEGVTYEYKITVIPTTTNIISIANVSAGVTVKWEKNDKATGYYIYRSINGGNYSKIATITGNKTVSYTDKDATKNGAKYQYMIAVYKTVGDKKYGSAFSTAKIMYRLKTIMSSVENASTGIKVKWARNTVASGYYVYRSVNGGAFTKIATIKSGTTLSYQDKKATKAGAKYQYKVCPYKTQAGVKYDGLLSDVKTTYKIGKPTVSSLKNTAAGKATVKWGKITGASGYEVRYVVGSKKKVINVTSGSTLSKVFSSLKKGSTVKVCVRAYKSVNGKKFYSVWSIEKSLKITK